MKSALVAISLSCIGSAAAAYDPFPSDFGELLGTEARCGLTFDQDVIAALVDEKMQAGDLAFSGIVTAYASISDGRLQTATDSAKTVICRAAATNAKALGILK